MGTPRLPLPSCIEDTFLAWLTGMVRCDAPDRARSPHSVGRRLFTPPVV